MVHLDPNSSPATSPNRPSKRPPKPAEGHARPRPLDPHEPLGRLLMALEVEPCDCKHSHPEGEAWHSVGFAIDERCMGWHVEPSAHRLHPDDWLRLLRAWSQRDYGKARQPAPATFKVVAAGLTECAAEDACRQSRLAVYEERAKRRQPVFCADDSQEATAADLEAMGLRIEMGGAV